MKVDLTEQEIRYFLSVLRYAQGELPDGLKEKLQQALLDETRRRLTHADST